MLNLQQEAGNSAVSRALSGRSAALPVQRVLSDSSDYSDSEEDSVYPSGTYGARSRARGRLSDRFGVPMTGNTHQEEHAPAYAATARYAPVPRRRNTRHEGLIPSYQETHRAHRHHVGTGSGTTVGRTGLSSRTYRDQQEQYLFDNDAHGAFLMNQLEYNEVDDFHRESRTVPGRQSDLSFRHMVRSNQPIPYYDRNGRVQQTSPLTPQQQTDLRVARETMRRRSQLAPAEQYNLLRSYGGSRFDDYPTRSRRPTLSEGLTDYPDLRDRSSSPLRIPPSDGLGRRDRSRPPTSSQRQLLEALARSGTTTRDDLGTSRSSRDRSLSRRNTVSSRSRSVARYDAYDSDDDLPVSSQRSRSRAPGRRLLDADFDDF
jgi:hypothetical protein